MKTTLIHIDPHDDLTSIKDKMTWSKSQRLLLIFPSEYPRSQADLVMKLVLRYAMAQGAQLAIVTRDRILCSIADEVGVKCFSSAPQAERMAWKSASFAAPVRLPKGGEAIRDQKKRLPETNITRAPTTFQRIITLVLLLTTIVLVFFFFFPSANIILYPVSTTQEITLTILAGPDIEIVDVSGRIPAIEISNDISGIQSTSSTGKIDLPVAKAIGFVEVTNSSGQDVFLPSGTILVWNSEQQSQFVLLENVNLGFLTTTPIAVEVEAIEPGVESNVPAAETFTIEGYENLIQVKNPSAITGGSDKTFPTPDAVDYEGLESRLEEELSVQCRDLLANMVTEEQTLIAESIKLEDSPSMVQSPAIGQPGDIATLSMTVGCSGYVIEKADEYLLAKKVLDQNLVDGRIPLDNEVLITTLSTANSSTEERFSWQVRVSRQVIPSWDVDRLAVDLVGKPVNEVNEFLDNIMPQVKPPTITIYPAWWQHMPLLPYRFTIEVGGK